MKVAIDLQKVFPIIFIVIFILACLSIMTAILLSGWTPTWQALHQPTLSPPFADMRTVQGALLSEEMGFDPQVTNPGDPWLRAMNYPQIWIWIAKLLQFDNETNFIIFVCAYVLAYIVCCFLLLRNAPSPYVLLAIFSGAPLLAVERGNNDLLVFVLLFAGIGLSEGYFRAVTILLAAVLKIYPFAAFFTLVKKPKILIPLVVIIAGYFVFDMGELMKLQAGNTAFTDPASAFASYGIDTNTKNIQGIFGGQSDATYALVKYALILVSLVLIALIARIKALSPTSPSAFKSDLFIAGGSIFFFTYLTSSNWDYRLVFLLLCMPYILSIQGGFVKHSMLIGILLALNAMLLMDFLGPISFYLATLIKHYYGSIGFYLSTLSKYYCFIMVSACLVRELYNSLAVYFPYFKPNKYPYALDK
jgi:hypothetical protein